MENQLFQPETPLQVQLFKEYAPFGRLEYSVNVNNKYSHLYQIDQNRHVGEGVRETYAYVCYTHKTEWQRYRKEFWETRNHGHPDVWKAFRKAVEAKSNDQAMEYLLDAKVKLILKKITLAIDRKGIRYELPVFVVNPPQTFGTTSLAERNLNKNYQQNEVDIVVRCVAVPSDTKFTLSNSTLVQHFKAAYLKKVELSDKKTRMFYNGRQMIDSYEIGQFNFVSGQVIQAMIS